MKQPSIFKTPHHKPHPIDSDEDEIYPFQKKSTDGPDDTESSDGEGSSVPDQYSLTPFSNTKHPSNIHHKKPSDKKDHRHPSNRPKKKDHLGHPQGKNKNSYNSFDPFSQPEKSDETDDLDYPDESGPPQSSQFPKGHRPKRPYQLTKRPDKSDDGPSDETDDLDYPNGSPSTFISQFPTFLPTKRPKKSKFSSRPDNSDQDSSDKQPDGWSPYDSNKNPSLTDGPVKGGFLNRPKRPGRSPYSGSPTLIRMKRTCRIHRMNHPAKGCLGEATSESRVWMKEVGEISGH